MSTVLISEIFGPTLQGEGFHVGYPTIFVRTGGCDYRCEWCDTMYAVLPEFKKDWVKMTAEEIMNKIRKLSEKPILVTFSGGNPALHDLSEIIDLGHKEGYTFTMETQGSVPKEWFNKLDFITFSPKPPSSMMKTDWDKLDESVKIMGGDTNKVSMKVVVSDEKDYRYATEVFDRYPEYPKFITPCNISPGAPDLESIYEKARYVTDLVLSDGRYDITILPQLHVLLWGNERGK